MTHFSDFAISEALKARLQTCNFITPTPVQLGAIPPALEGRDVLATAQTGTGKTLSFLIPIIEKISAQPKGRNASALILLPTRELAMQVEKACRTLMPQLRTVLVVGGMAEGPQLEHLRRGVQMIVATPGRLEDYIDRSLVRLNEVRTLVLDEVDRMLDMGFQPAIRRIVQQLGEKQTLCYSATLDKRVQQVVHDYLKAPVRVEIGSVLKPSENVELRAFEVSQDSKLELLQHLVRSEQGSFIVFVRTKHGADRIATRLQKVGIESARIHGDRTQSQRNAALRSFSQGQYRVLVATDVAARGIDVAHVAHVINYDMPKEAEDFVHRVGRTGRNSARGVASTFTTPGEQGDLRKIERQLAIKIKRFRVRANETSTQLSAV